MVTLADIAVETVPCIRSVLMPPADLKLEDWRHYEGMCVVLNVLSETGHDFEIHVVPFLSGSRGVGAAGDLVFSESGVELCSVAVTRIVVLDNRGESLEVLRSEDMTRREQESWDAEAAYIFEQDDVLRESIESERIGEFT